MDAKVLARDLFLKGEDLKAGEMLAKAVPAQEQPRWAANLLELVAYQYPVPQTVSELIKVAKDPKKWPSARTLFGELRNKLLEIEKTPSKFEQHLVGVLYLAENVAKLTYNASGGSAPYDADSAWWIPQNVRYVLEHSEHRIDRDRLLAALFG